MSFIKAPKLKQPKCLSTGQWINKIWYSHSMECYLAVKRNKLPKYIAMQMNLEIIMLREKKTVTKDHRLYYFIYNTCPEQRDPQI